MDDDCEKTLVKGQSMDENSLLDSLQATENSNGVLDAFIAGDDSNTFASNADFDENNSQSCPLSTFDCGDNTFGFQENSLMDVESLEIPPVVSDLSHNGDSSNMPTLEIQTDSSQSQEAVTKKVTEEVETTLDGISEPEDQSQNNTEPIMKPVADSQEEMIKETKSQKPAEIVKQSKAHSKDHMIQKPKSQETIMKEIKIMRETKTDLQQEMKEDTKSHKTAEVMEETKTDPQEETIQDSKSQKTAETSEETKKGPQEEMMEESMVEALKQTQAMVKEADTEVVSEDELPAVEKPRVQDAENVSDDELPGPKPAELPADTEVVSEDELPSNKDKDKMDEATEDSGSGRKRKPDDDEHSQGSDTDPSSKKQAVAKNGESKPVPAEKRPSVEERDKKKKPLPELDKYWKTVNEDASDFTGWTYLLQYVDQENDVDAAREAYDAFLSHYPYCYGYWRKYADYEKRKGSKKKCSEVLDRGLKAIPLSVDLWIHYLNHIKSTRSDDIPYVRQQYDRAIEACGLEFRSDRLWESYIKFETEHGTPLHVTNVYDRLLATPTLGYTSHFDNFQEHIMSEAVQAVVSRDELVRLRSEVREGSVAPPPSADLPPGEDEPPDHVASEEEGQAVKERIIAARRKVHKATGEQVTQRWTFEEGIKRPYFHVKPLERSQLKNWKNYLEWEKQHGSFRRALVLHERCLIACALYEEFWLRLVKFLEEASETDSGLVGVEREALERACLVHHPDKPTLHMHWAYFEEVQGNAAKAAEILERLDKKCPNLLQVAYRRINLERRRGDLDKCGQLYESYIASAKNKAVASALSVKYARFLHRVRNDAAGAQKVLAEALVREPLAHRLYLQQLDIALHTPDAKYQQMEGYLSAYEKVEGADLETVGAMAARRLELAEEVGSAADARNAYSQQRAVEKRLSKRARQSKNDSPPSGESAPKQSKQSQPTTTAGATPAPAAPPHNYYTPAAAPPQHYEQPPYQQQYQPQWNYQQPTNPYHPNPWGQYPPNYY